MRNSVAQRRLVQNRALAVGIFASVVAHAAVLSVGPFHIELPAETSEASARVESPAPTEIMRLVTLDEPTPVSEPSATSQTELAESESTATASAAVTREAILGALAADMSRKPLPVLDSQPLASQGAIVATEVQAIVAESDWAVASPGDEAEEDRKERRGGLGGLFDGLGDFLGGINVTIGGGRGLGGKGCGPLIPNIIPQGPRSPSPLGGGRTGGGAGRFPHSHPVGGSLGSGGGCTNSP